MYGSRVLSALATLGAHSLGLIAAYVDKLVVHCRNDCGEGAYGAWCMMYGV
jgi:hypothetical protein